MVKTIITLLLTIISQSLLAQIQLSIEGTIINDTTSGTSAGVVIPRNQKTIFTYRNNSVTSLNEIGYMLQAGDENPRVTNNNLDGEIITGNKFTWNGTSLPSITHAVFTGYNINVVLKYNYLDKTPLGLLRKSDGMTDTSGGTAYNIVINPKVAFAAKGINNVKAYNNTFYSSKTLLESANRALVDIYANIGESMNEPSTGAKIFNNIFYTKYQIPNISVESSCLPGFESDYNLYWCESGDPLFVIGGETVTFAQWQSLGYDKHSVVINPDFINFTDLVPGKRLDYGIDLGSEWQSGLSTDAIWSTTDPALTDQNGTWQVGARIYKAKTDNRIQGTIRYNNSSFSLLDSTWVYLFADNICIDSIMSDASGRFQFYNVRNGQYTISGHCKKSWKGVNATDAILIQRHFAGLELLSAPVTLLAADVNETNTIDITDAMDVKNRFAGLQNTFSRGDWIFTTPDGDNTLFVNNSDVTADLHGLCVGDVNGSQILSNKYSLNSNKVSITHIGVMEVRPLLEFNLPIRILSACTVNAISMVIPFPDELLEVKEIITPFGSPTFTTLNNTIRIAWSELQSLNLHQGDTLFILRLKATNKFTDDAKIELVTTDESELADESGNVIPLAELFTQTIKPLNTTDLEDLNSILKECVFFPNPASDVLNCELVTSKKAVLWVELTNMAGNIKTCKAGNELLAGKNTFSLNTADLAAGVYVVKLSLDAENVRKTYSSKLIINR